MEHEAQATAVPLLLETTDAAMRKAITTAWQAAGSDIPVILIGEQGTGKRRLAAAIHAWSDRHARPFVRIPCAALVERILEQGLLGEAGSGATPGRSETIRRLRAARTGTLFLEELDELDADLQTKLLRVVARDARQPGFSSAAGAEGPRVILSANGTVDLLAPALSAVRHHLATIAVPPLRSRGADLPALIDVVVEHLTARYRRPGLRVSPETRRALAAYSWPGNVRELVDALEHAVVLATSAEILPADLPDRVQAAWTTCRAARRRPVAAFPATERDHIARIVAASQTLQEAAARLGINPTTLWRKRKRYGLA